MKDVLVLGACGYMAPYVTPGLEPDYRLHLADVKPHPLGKPIIHVDVTSYEEVAEASRGMDAIMNFAVNRDDPVQSFRVNVLGAYHVMRCAAEHGIKKVIHTGPQFVLPAYGHDFDIDDVPPRPGTRRYMLTKYLSTELCKSYARAYGIQTICLLFNAFRARPDAPVPGRDLPPFEVAWEDVQHACRLALDIDEVPEGFQALHMLSYLAQGKFRADKAGRVLGYAPLENLDQYFGRRTAE